MPAAVWFVLYGRKLYKKYKGEIGTVELTHYDKEKGEANEGSFEMANEVNKEKTDNTEENDSNKEQISTIYQNYDTKAMNGITPDLEDGIVNWHWKRVMSQNEQSNIFTKLTLFLQPTECLCR